MAKSSFRTVIIITLVLIISTISFSAFFIYSYFLEKKMYAQSEKKLASAIDLFREQFYITFKEHDGRSIKTFLQKLQEKDWVLNSYLFDANGKMKYSMKGDSLTGPGIRWNELSDSETGVIFQSFKSEKIPFDRAFFRMNNEQLCHRCHAPELKNLGYIIIDVSIDDTIGNIKFIRKSSFLFTLVMLTFIIVFILLMHYQFVRKRLREFHVTINAINHGNLDKRLSIPETRELGKLGKNFNNMLNTLQRTQIELQEFHRKEMRSNYKLATIGEMSARLAHEIRNPVTGIANAIEIIAKETDNKEHVAILDEIQRQAHRVNDAITGLLKYSRKKDLVLIQNDINETIKTLVFFLENQIKNKVIGFSLNLDGNVQLFRFDLALLEDAMLNLGLNAIQAIQQSGTITFTTRFDEALKRVFVYVADNGKGINPEDLSRVFHPFFTTKNEGTGLGLAIVKDVIDKHGGEIWVENNKTGGCTFTFWLPFIRE